MNGSRKISPKMPINSPMPMARKKLVERKMLACSTFLAPSRRLMLLPAPWPSIKPKAWRIAISEKTIPVAPLAATLILLTKNVSAVL